MRDNIMPLPYKEPSQVLITLLQAIVEDGRRFANTADLQVSDMSGQSPVGTTLAILERTLKVMSAVQARIHYSMKQELGLLKAIIAAYTPEDYDYDPQEGDRKAKKADYDMVAVIPVSDPNASTMAQKIVQYQAVIQLAQQNPAIYNLPLLHRQMLDVMGVKDSNKLVPMEDSQQPTDPVTENQNILTSKPVKAFLNQEHQAHITVHQSLMQDPNIQKLMQGNPLAQQMQAAMMAHINEHLAFEYRKQIEQQLGRPLPPQTDDSGEDMPMDPQVEAKLAPMLAQAAQKLLQKNQASAAQQQAAQQQQDPIIQMQQQELEIKKQSEMAKAMKMKADVDLKQQQLALEKQRIDNQAQQAASKTHMDGVKTAAQLMANKKTHLIDTSVDVLKHLSDQHAMEVQNTHDAGHKLGKHHSDQQHQMAQKVMDQMHQMELAKQQQEADAKQAAQSTQPTEGE